MAKVTGDIQGVFDTDLGKLVGIVPVGTNDVSWFSSQPSPTPSSNSPATTDGTNIYGPNGQIAGGGGSTTVVDNLTSTSTTSALSANQGRVLNGLIPSVVNDLTTGGVSAALSAQQGVVLKSGVDANTAAVAAITSAYVAAPATLDASNAASLNGKQLSLAAGATMTVSDAAWALLTSGVSIYVGQSGSATLTFSGTAVKENSAGTSATSVTLSAAGLYTLTQSPGGSPKFRLAGGASL